MSHPSTLREPQGRPESGRGATSSGSSRLFDVAQGRPEALEGRASSRDDWDAARYDRVSEPQVGWGRRVIARLAPGPGERILDLGCGTGRLTLEIAATVSGGFVLAFDTSEAMLKVARQAAPALVGHSPSGPIRFVRGDGRALPFVGVFDAVFSTATLHWIADHEMVFRSVLGALRPEGRLVAQCGGGPNLHRLYEHASESARRVPYSSYFDGWRDPWYFALPEPTSNVLGRAGFIDIDAALEAAPVSFHDAASFSEFIGCVCVRHHLQRLPPHLQSSFLSELTLAAEADDPPFTLDYWRLNIFARRPPA